MLGLAALRAAPPDVDSDRVRQAAGLLRIPEFTFFRLAHQRWYGHSPSDQEIEPYFMLYLYRRRVPIWVRHLAREIMARARSGRVSPQDFGVRPVLPPPPSFGRADAARTVALTIIYGVVFAMVTIAAA